MTLLLGGALGDVADLPPLHQEAYLLCERVGDEKRALLARAIDLSNMPDPRKDRDALDVSMNERRFMNAMLTHVFHSWSSDAPTASALGAYLLGQAAADNDLDDEIQRLRTQWLTGPLKETQTEALGELALVYSAPDSNEPPGAYPVIRREALRWVAEQMKDRRRSPSHEGPPEADRQ